MKKQIMLGGLLLLLGSCTPQKKANDPNAIDIAVSLEHLTELKDPPQLGKTKSVISLGNNRLIPDWQLLFHQVI
mgnify:CR=1 FL=1